MIEHLITYDADMNSGATQFLLKFSDDEDSEDENDHIDAPVRKSLLINETGTKTLGPSWDPL